MILKWTRTAGGALSFTVWLGVVSGIIGVFSFIFAVWVWMRSDLRVRELTRTLEAIYKISGDALWETAKIKSRTTEEWLRQAGQALGFASGIHTLAKQQLSGTPGYQPNQFEVLIQNRLVYTQSMINNIEKSAITKEVWVITPDLEPDISQKETGKLVGANIRNGKRYVYFVPGNLSDLRDLLLRLKSNLGIDPTKSRLDDRVALVQIDAQEFWLPHGSGNVIFFFDNDPQFSRGNAFKEIVFTQVSDRGIFWQECADTEAESLYRFLRHKLEEQHM